MAVTSTPKKTRRTPPGKKLVKRALKGGIPVLKAEPDPFRCPVHEVKMVYFPTLMKWECIEHGCKEHQWPIIDQDGGRPVIGTGELEIVVVTHTPRASRRQEHKFFLRSINSNIMIDITQHLAADVTIIGNNMKPQVIRVNRPGSPVAIGPDRNVELSLLLHNVVEVDSEGEQET